MKYKLLHLSEYLDGVLPSNLFLNCYDMIGDDTFIGYVIDEAYLRVRSALEFVREQL